MSRDSKRLLQALQAQRHVTPERVRMAAIILQCNGIDAALQYVEDAGMIIPLEAAEMIRDEDCDEVNDG